MELPSVFAGVDVSKARLDVAVTGLDETWSVANDPGGIVELIQRLCEVRPTLVVMEATGGFEVAAAATLAAAEIPVVIANPRQVRDFAKSTGQLAKTDAIDAHIGRPVSCPPTPDVRWAPPDRYRPPRPTLRIHLWKAGSNVILRSRRSCCGLTNRISPFLS